MPGFDTNTGGNDRGFRTTIWSDVLEAGDPDHPECQKKLALLLERYWKPVYAFIRVSWRKSVEDAKDLTQGFLAHFLEKGYLSRLRPERGSFRGYLKEALRHYLIDRNRAEAARRPSGGLFALDATPEEFERLEPAAPDETPERAYDREWFRSLLEMSVRDLKMRLEGEGKGVYYEVFRLYCLGSSPDPGRTATFLQGGDSSENLSYQEVADRVGVKETDVRNYLTYCRRTLRQIMREHVRDYVATEEDLDNELWEVAGK